MLPLELREEFRSPHMRGTAIELRNRQNTGWAQRDAADPLRITYPTADVQRALEAVSRSSAGRPIVLKGPRGRGKSHSDQEYRNLWDVLFDLHPRGLYYQGSRRLSGEEIGGIGGWAVRS